MAPAVRTVKCPKCKTPLEPCGEVWKGDERLDVYQCDGAECVVDWVVEGITFPAAYTFLVGPDGIPFDPTDPIDPTFN